MKIRTFSLKTARNFGSGHSKPYDWRDDPKYNPYQPRELSSLGYNLQEMPSPFNCSPSEWHFNTPMIDFKNLNTIPSFAQQSGCYFQKLPVILLGSISKS